MVEIAQMHRMKLMHVRTYARPVICPSPDHSRRLARNGAGYMFRTYQMIDLKMIYSHLKQRMMTVDEQQTKDPPPAARGDVRGAISNTRQSPPGLLW